MSIIILCLLSIFIQINPFKKKMNRHFLSFYLFLEKKYDIPFLLQRRHWNPCKATLKLGEREDSKSKGKQ